MMKHLYMLPRIFTLLLLFICPFLAEGQTQHIRLKFEDGQIKAHFNSKGGERHFTLDAFMATTAGSATTELVSQDSTGIITKKYVKYFEHACEITSVVKQTPYGLQWDIYIKGQGGDWTAPVETSLQWADAGTLQFWTSWADNHQQPASEEWQDPFLPAPFNNLALVYGGENHLSRDAFVTPIASSFFKGENLGLSFIQSLKDTILDLELHTSANGKIAYRHLNHRIGSGRTVHICHQLVFHEADWRAGMAWMAANYPGYFLPGEPLVNKIAGCGAYSSYEGKLDTAKYREMGFSLNWKASLDFPYMGLFIPPVKSDDELWTKYRQRGVKVGDGCASISRLSAYSKHLAQMGFNTISYFNVAEFGNGMVYPYKGAPLPDSELWKNPNDFVYTRLKQALLKPAGILPDWDERPLFSNWEDCVVLDPGDPAYRAFLLEQARLHIAKIPSSAGICIDRMDWQRFYNSSADDGISMVQQQKTRAMVTSWKEIMGQLGPLMHAAHKVIFCNPLDRRIDLMEQVDGIYDEFGYLPSSLNLCAQMALLKPIIAWTASKDNLAPDPDAYFQRHLYLGAFLTVPYPGNDHCITPDTGAEKYYTDYGRLLQAIKGREWVMYPHVVEVENGTAKANVFKANGKIIIPVVLGGSSGQASVIIRLPFAALGKQNLSIKVLYPGEKDWHTIKSIKFGKEIRLAVPLKRGCALISIG
ncbi:hypothetical protein [Mucilaginibacter sp.]|uniref:hypothetical protein n=1 Tax=Mucilaginibacter sp. TaxID=1882438 RepID=UPI00283ADE98|nr:hypothetical protein [Mucilaginibacter sp.]MDR3697444.1 hypothetical protein [Mucilaginibacter sp.]